MAAAEHVALSEFRITLNDGSLAEFVRGKIYDGPPEHIPNLLKPHERVGPLVASKSSPEGKAALFEAKAKQPDEPVPANTDTEGR